mgnify:CR=1 FL=1
MAQSKIERYLIDLTLTYSEMATDMWLIEDASRGLEGIVVVLDEPLVLIRLAIMKVPTKRREECFLKLLELNANDVLHGAYAIDKDEVVLIDTLNYETMDLGDFQASIDSIGLAVVQHYPILSEFYKD